MKKVFVVHGRNEALRRGLFEFLRAIGLEPIEWSEAVGMTEKASPYIGDVLQVAFDQAQAVVVLQTPDDIAYLTDSLGSPGDPDKDPKPQPRPNVIFEAGMAMGRNPDRTVLVELGAIRPYSDIHGRHVVRLDNSVARRQELAQRLKAAGCEVNLSGTDWHEAGDLTPPDEKVSALPLGKKKAADENTRSYPELRAYLSGDRIFVINRGPGDAFNVRLFPVESERIFFALADDAVPKLPQGKSVPLLQKGPATLSQKSVPFVNVRITATTADGTPFEAPDFVSL